MAISALTEGCRHRLICCLINVGTAIIALSFSAFLLAKEVAAAETAVSHQPSRIYLETLDAIRMRPDDIRQGNTLRAECRKNKQVDQCIDDLNKLADTYPGIREIRYNAALAYVDKLPGFSLYRQGWLSTRSIAHMTTVIDKHPDDWLAFYIRGMNNLHWPLWFQRTGMAIEDLQRCIDIVETSQEKAVQAYYVLCYVALGDAHVKANQPQQAHAVWERGLALYPAKQIKERLNLKDNELSDYVAAVRDLNKPIDTDLAFLWDKSRL